MKRSTTALFVVLILGSLTLGLAAMLLQAGHDATPYGTRDSQGHPLGFNDPITSELCWIMVSHVTLGSFIQGLGWYGVLYLLMHLIGLALVLRDRFGIQKWYFWSQMVWFPTVWLILLMIGRECVAVLSGTIQGALLVLDGETFQDGPPFWWMAQPSWLVVSVLIASNGTWGPRAQTMSAGPGSLPVNNATPSRPSDRLRVFASLR